MNARLESIVRNSDHEYSVSLALTGQQATETFTFRVGEDDLQLVSCDDAFASYFGMAMQHATSIYAAVLAFHRAKGHVPR